MAAVTKTKKKAKPVAYGMPKREALALIASDKYSWADLEKMMTEVAPQIRKIQSESSKISLGVPLKIIFHVAQRTASKIPGRPKGSKYESTAINLLREFGVK